MLNINTYTYFYCREYICTYRIIQEKSNKRNYKKEIDSFLLTIIHQYGKSHLLNVLDQKMLEISNNLQVCYGKDQDEIYIFNFA